MNAEKRSDYMNLDRLYDSVDEIKANQVRIGADVEYIKKSIDRHNHLIDGNGKKGCIDRLTVIEEKTEELGKSVGRRFSGIYWMFAISVTILIACFELLWRQLK